MLVKLDQFSQVGMKKTMFETTTLDFFFTSFYPRLIYKWIVPSPTRVSTWRAENTKYVESKLEDSIHAKGPKKTFITKNQRI